MRFTEQEIYHVYNRGNLNEQIFFSQEHYEYFLRKVNYHLQPCTNMLGWCLLPNRFHFLIQATEETCAPKRKAIIPIQVFSEGIRLLLSSYTNSINKQRNRKGNLFQQRTKAISLSKLSSIKLKPESLKIMGDINYSRQAFQFLHQLPVRAGLVTKPGDWEFSSFNDYSGARVGYLCKKELAFSLLGLEEALFLEESNEPIPTEIIELLFHTPSWSDTL